MIPVFTRIIGVSIVCLASLFGLAMPLPASPNRDSVLVFAIENQTDDRNVDWIGTGLSELIVERLTAERDLYVFNRDERSTAYERMGIPESVAVTRATAMSIGWDTGADFVGSAGFSGRIRIFGSKRILNLQNSSSGLNVIVDGDIQNLIPMASTLSFKLARQLVPSPRHRSRITSRTLPFQQRVRSIHTRNDCHGFGRAGLLCFRMRSAFIPNTQRRCISLDASTVST
jgi:TolB-like protein